MEGGECGGRERVVCSVLTGYMSAAMQLSTAQTYNVLVNRKVYSR